MTHAQALFKDSPDRAIHMLQSTFPSMDKDTALDIATKTVRPAFAGNQLIVEE